MVILHIALNRLNNQCFFQVFNFHSQFFSQLLIGFKARRVQSAVQLEDLAADLGHFPGEPWIDG